jgi:hypothetical protein
MDRRRALATVATLSATGCLRLSGDPEATETGGGTDSGGDENSGSSENDESDENSGNTTGNSDVDIWVAPESDDESSERDGSEDAPFTDPQRAFSVAEPGETVYLKSGEYRLNGRTHGGGEPGNPIEITGPRDAVVRAREGGDDLFAIIHSHVHVTGLTFDGLADPERKWEDPEAWAHTLAVISPGPRYEAEGVDYLEDVVFEPHAVRNAGSTFVHIERTRDASLGDFEVAGPAGGAFHPEMSDPVESHVGNVFHVGSSTPTIQDYKPWDGLDRTRNVRIHHVDNSAGYHHSAFASIRVGCEEITVEYCTDRNAGHRTTDKQSVPVVNLGGNNCTIRGNDFGDCRQGVEFSAWTPRDLAEATNWARNNDLYSNRFQSVSEKVFLFRETTPDAQRTLCDNRLVGVEDGAYEYARGECDTDVSEVDGIGHTAGE